MPLSLSSLSIPCTCSFTIKIVAKYLTSLYKIHISECSIRSRIALRSTSSIRSDIDEGSQSIVDDRIHSSVDIVSVLSERDLSLLLREPHRHHPIHILLADLRASRPRLQVSSQSYLKPALIQCEVQNVLFGLQESTQAQVDISRLGGGLHPTDLVIPPCGMGVVRGDLRICV